MISTEMKLSILYTNADGKAAFTDLNTSLVEQNPRIALSQLFSSSGFQLRRSPAGVFNDWHCTANNSSQLVVVMRGVMEVELRCGTRRQFLPGSFFLSMDYLPEGETFTDGIHGHTSRESSGIEPLETLFVRVPAETAEELLKASLTG